MKIFGAFDAKTHLSKLLDQGRSGESFVITKRGNPIASLAPVSPSNHPGPKDLVFDFRKRFAKSLKPFIVEEFKELKAKRKPMGGMFVDASVAAKRDKIDSV